MMGTSTAVGHGTAMKKNATGNAKWRTHGLPPTHHRYKRVSVATEAAWIHPSGRHSGVAISKRRTGKSNSSAPIAITSVAAGFGIWDLGFEISAGGASCQRSQKR